MKQEHWSGPSSLIIAIERYDGRTLTHRQFHHLSESVYRELVFRHGSIVAAIRQFGDDLGPHIDRPQSSPGHDCLFFTTIDSPVVHALTFFRLPDYGVGAQVRWDRYQGSVTTSVGTVTGFRIVAAPKASHGDVLTLCVVVNPLTPDTTQYDGMTVPVDEVSIAQRTGLTHWNPQPKHQGGRP